MNSSIFITALLLNTTSNIIICFINYLKLKKEQPMKVAFLFSKVIPLEYEHLPYKSIVNLYVPISYGIIVSTVILTYVYTNWWQAIIVFVMARLISTVITRLFIDRKGFWQVAIIANILSLLILLIVIGCKL